MAGAEEGRKAGKVVAASFVVAIALMAVFTHQSVVGSLSAEFRENKERRARAKAITADRCNGPYKEVRLTQATIQEALDRHLIWVATKGRQGEQANFCLAILGGANFEKAILIEADFSGSELQRANFRGAYIANASFNAANLLEVN